MDNTWEHKLQKILGAVKANAATPQEGTALLVEALALWLGHDEKHMQGMPDTTADIRLAMATRDICQLFGMNLTINDCAHGVANYLVSQGLPSGNRRAVQALKFIFAEEFGKCLSYFLGHAD